MTSLLEYYGSNTDIIVEVVGAVAQKHMVDSEVYDNPMSVSAAMDELCEYELILRIQLIQLHCHWNYDID